MLRRVDTGRRSIVQGIFILDTIHGNDGVRIHIRQFLDVLVCDRLNKKDRLKKLEQLSDHIHSWAAHEYLGKSAKHERAIKGIIKEDLHYIYKLKVGIMSRIIDDEMTSEDMKKCNTLFTKYRSISNIEMTFKDD